MSLPRILIALGASLIALGALLLFLQRLPIRLGRLPGDIVIRGKSGVFYFPLATCLLLSLLASLLLWLFQRR